MCDAKVRTPNVIVQLFKAELEVDSSRTTTKQRQLSSEVKFHWVTAKVFWWTELPTTFDDFDLDYQMEEEEDLLKSKRTTLPNLFHSHYW